MMKRNTWIWLIAFILLAGIVVDHAQAGRIPIDAWVSKITGKAAKEEPSLTTMAAQYALKPGTPAPSFSLPGLDGGRYEVGGARDKVLLLNFWASWCDPCKEEAPDLVNLASRYQDSLDLFAVNVTLYDKLEQVEQFVKEYGYTFPVLLDEDEEIYRKFGGVAFPTNVLIDKDGIIRDVIVGTLAPDELEAKIKEWM